MKRIDVHHHAFPEKFEAIFEDLNRRNAVAFIHPTDPGPQFDPGLDVPVALIEAPFDTTRAVANLMFNGRLFPAFSEHFEESGFG